MARTPNREEWQAVAKAVSNETDSGKLIGLIGELCHALDRTKASDEKSSSQSNVDHNQVSCKRVENDKVSPREPGLIRDLASRKYDASSKMPRIRPSGN